MLKITKYYRPAQTEMGNRQVKQTLNIYATKLENPEKRLVFLTPMSCSKEPFNFNLKQEN